MVGVPIPLFLFSPGTLFLFTPFLLWTCFASLLVFQNHRKNMQSINEDNSIQLFKLDKSNEVKIRSERSFVLSQFVEEINKERLSTKWQPITGRAVAMKVSHLKDNGTLYYFLSQCRDYKNRHGSFSKYFFGALKVK